MEKKILEAAIYEFAEKGFRFTMNDVAKSIGISKKTIYTVYDSKEMLMECIVDHYFAEYLERQKWLEQNPDMDVVEKIECILCTMPEEYHDIEISNLYELWNKYPKIHDKLQGYIDQVWKLVEGYLIQGMEEGKIREVSLPILMTMLRGTVRQYVENRVFLDGAGTYEEIKKEMVNVTINGIRQK